jgi:hypothetical protein
LEKGLRLRVGGDFEFSSGQGLNLKGKPGRDGWGVNVNSEQGAVRVYGGGRSLEGSQSVRADPNADEGRSPSLLLEGRETVRVQAGQNIDISAPTVRIENASEVSVNALTSVAVVSGDALNVTSKTFNKVTNGKSIETFSGPKDGVPTNGSVRKIDIIANPATGFLGGVSDEYRNVYGDRKEEFLFGNHKTTCLIGNLTYKTNLGTWKAKAGLNEITVGASGMSAQMMTGNVSLNAVAGQFISQSAVGATVRTTGPAVLSGSTSVTLGGPGKIGPIVSGSDLDPLTGIPLIALGMGSPGHLIGPAI